VVDYPDLKKGGNKMRKLYQRLIPTILVVIILLALTVMPAGAATYEEVTVTATPTYIAISNSQAAWTLNGITGSGTVAVDTVYYANPTGDTNIPTATVDTDEGYFQITNDSNVDIDITMTCGAFTGGNATMTNSNDGSNGVDTYGAYSWYEGMTYASKVVMKSAASDVTWTSSSPGDDIDLGAEIETRTNAWAGSGSSTATMTITAT
jgi:hypothetical protein